MRIVAPCVVWLLVTGCIHVPGGIAPSTIPLEPDGYTVVAESVEGSDCLVAILGLIPVSGGNRTENAIRDAILSAPSATALINVTSDAYTAYWILWSQTCTVVRGTAVVHPRR